VLSTALRREVETVSLSPTHDKGDSAGWLAFLRSLPKGTEGTAHFDISLNGLKTPAKRLRKVWIAESLATLPYWRHIASNGY